MSGAGAGAIVRWLVVLLFLAVPVTGQAPSGLEVTIESHVFDYGPEDWKDGFPVDDQGSFTARVAGWNASLGSHLDLHVRAEPRGANAGNDWQYQAWLSDGVVEVEGLVTPDPAGRFEVRFDVDGQRALPGMAAVPALVPGTWTLRVRATTDDATGNPVPEGSGQTRLLTRALEALPPTVANVTIPAIRVPESLLPHITEVGPDAVWFNRAPHPPGVPAFFEAVGEGVAWQLWWQEPAGPATLPAVLSDVGTTWRHQPLQSAEADGVSRTAFFPTSSTEGLFIVAAIDPVHGGSQVWAMGVSGEAATIRSIQAPTPGSEGAVRVGLTTTTGAAPGLAFGQLYALALSEQGASIITSSPLLPDGAGHASAALDGRSLRAHRGAYRAVALLEDAGTYNGHVVMDRGVEVTLDLPVLGEGTPASGVLRLRSLSDDGRAERNPDLQANGTLVVSTGDTTLAVPFEVVEGGTIEIPFDFTPEAAGALVITATIDTGDTYTRLDRVVSVLDASTYEQEAKPWYDPGKYVPGPPLALVLLAIALLGRKR